MKPAYKFSSKIKPRELVIDLYACYQNKTLTTRSNDLDI